MRPAWFAIHNESHYHAGVTTARAEIATAKDEIDPARSAYVDQICARLGMRTSKPASSGNTIRVSEDTRRKLDEMTKVA